MQIILNQNDVNKLQPKTREDLMSLLFSKQKVAAIEGTEAFEWGDVVEFTPSQISEFISGCSEQTTNGLRIFAEHGPVINASLLEEVGISNYGSFQGSCTKRARTVSTLKDAYLFSWDDWDSEENNGVGHYAVTAITYASLCNYFGLPSKA